MARKKSSRKSKSRKSRSRPYDWRLHNSYDSGSSSSRVVTRSQAAFARVHNTPSDTDLFADPSRHEPPGLPHLMVAVKGMWGSVPNTTITRTAGREYPVSQELCDTLEEYKRAEPSGTRARRQQEEEEEVEVEDQPAKTRKKKSAGRGKKRKG